VLTEYNTPAPPTPDVNWTDEEGGVEERDIPELDISI